MELSKASEIKIRYVKVRTLLSFFPCVCEAYLDDMFFGELNT